MTSTISIHPTFNVASTYSTLGLREHTFAWALIGSFVLHILVVSVLPKLHFQRAAQQEIMHVVLAPAPKPQPEPEPVRPQAVPKPEPRPTPAPHHVIAPSPIAEEPLSHAEPAPEPTPPAVITAPVKPEAPPTFTAPPPPPPEPPRPSSPSQQDIDAARNLYGSLLGREIAKYKQYPEIARRRSWQGEVVVDIQLDKNGNLQSSTIQKSSNHEALDKQALEMVKKAAPFPAPPEALRGSVFNILVPVSFHLE